MAEAQPPDPVTLEGAPGLPEVEALVPRLRAALDAAASGAPAVVETAGLERCHAGLLQALVAARISADRRGLPLEVRLPEGGALEAAMRRAGLDARVEGGVWTGPAGGESAA